MCFVLLMSMLPASARATQTTDTRALLDRAAITMGSLKTYHFNLTTPEGETPIMEEYTLDSVEGAVQRPDKLQAEVAVEVNAFLSVTADVIRIGDCLWLSDPTTEQEGFERITANEYEVLAELLDPDRIVRTAIAHIQQPSVIEIDEIGDEEGVRVQGRLAPEHLGVTAPESVAREPLGLDLWITESGHVLRLVLEGALIEGESDDVVHRLELSDFDEPVEVSRPKVA